MWSCKLALVLSVIHLVVSSVHNVVAPVNSYVEYTINHLLNHSNVQLNFFSDVYHINSRIFMRNVQNITLNGSLINGVIGTIFRCSLIGGIIVTNSSNINIKGITFENCMSYWRVKLSFQKFDVDNGFLHASLLVIDSHSVNIQYINVFGILKCNIVLINTLATLYEISSQGIAALYNDDYVKLKNQTHDLMISSFYPACDSCQHYEISIYTTNYSGYFNAELSEINF